MGIKKSVSKLKKELDSWFSKYIRLRESNDYGMTECFTCGKVDYYKKLQNGHFQSRRHHYTRWNEQNCQVTVFIIKRQLLFTFKKSFRYLW